MPDRKASLRAALIETRERTLRLFEAVPDDFLKVRVHDFYSPVGWHFGHIGRTEVYWACEAALNLPCPDDALSFLFANIPENPKDNRTYLPDRSEIRAYLDRTRQLALDALETADITSDHPLLADGYAWEFALQHECQHQETIVELMQLIQKRRHSVERARQSSWLAISSKAFARKLNDLPDVERVAVPGGTFLMGSAVRHHYDNEQQPHPVTVAPFSLDRTPVTNARWLAFLCEGGYHRPELWTDAGFVWRTENKVEYPEYWLPDDEQGFVVIGPNGLRAMNANEPVLGISWYEADAFARWVKKRLPTEEEWEFAAAFAPSEKRVRRYPWGDDEPTVARASFGLTAWQPEPVGSCPAGATEHGIYDMAGSVWEWTASPFLPYPGFVAYPYDGYSKEHMDGHHFVCRGGSWATSGPILRCSFRNWYVPTYRQGFLGLRCAV